MKEPRSCAGCGATFVPKTTKNVYCSRACRAVWASKLWKQRNREYVLLHGREREKRRRERDPERIRALTREAGARWRSAHPDTNRERNRLYLKLARIEALEAYAGSPPACACCGEAIKQFLTIDHIAGRRAMGHGKDMTGHKLYIRLRQEGWPPGYRVLCNNCNQAIGFYGTCPHTWTPETRGESV